jgi:hypothetical protein
MYLSFLILFVSEPSHFELTVICKCQPVTVPCRLKVKVKVIPQQAELAQGVPGRLRPQIFLTFGTTRVVGRQPYSLAAFTSGEIPDFVEFWGEVDKYVYDSEGFHKSDTNVTGNPLCQCHKTRNVMKL